MCQLFFSMTASTKVLRKELNSVTKPISDVPLHSKLLKSFLIFKVTVVGVLGWVFFCFVVVFFKSNALFFSISCH